MRIQGLFRGAEPMPPKLSKLCNIDLHTVTRSPMFEFSTRGIL